MNKSNEVWTVEHREMHSQTMDCVQMHVASTQERAIAYIEDCKEINGWFVVSREYVDVDFFEYENLMFFYSVKGELLQEQPINP